MYSPNDGAPLRRLVYALLITVAVGMAGGRIVSAQRVYEPALARDEKAPDDRRPAWPKARPNPMPTFSSNDRSRWATVRALVDSPEPTFVIGRRDLTVTLASAVAPFGTTDPLAASALAGAGYHARV